MRVRIKFQKFGAMKFIGHLDVMRYFQKAFRRAGIDSEYSKGYSPHQIMSFAAPLGVGLTSDGEYLDVSLLSSDSPAEMIERINSVLTEGFHITGFQFLEDPEPGRKVVTAMSLVASADYMVSLKDGSVISEGIKTRKEFQEAFDRFYGMKEIVIEKETKKSVQTVDIKPMISFVAYEEEEYQKGIENLIKEGDRTLTVSESTADQYENGIKVYLQLDTGSTANLKPELVMEAFYKFSGVPFEKFAWQIHRLEVYTREEERNRLIPLDCAGIRAGVEENGQ